eukprot:TRINITY_DN2778_c0_g1_i1.p1 TRINITY_DN2778_c0_g1~~TRINITY_DN2778_c0_g1_i1.p1  ORF type:complete len:305 (-),score=67.01 TRINITY_DN2778_c0_g1_i1:35-949(-)
MNYTLDSGADEKQGRRDTMEDTHVHLDSVNKESEWPFSSIAYYGVYDGHGGKTTADFVAEELHKTIFGSQEFKEGKPEESISQSFEQVDKIIVEKANAEGWMNGTTAAVTMILDGTLYAANVGDAEACLVSVEDDKITNVEDLTYPHKASDPDEKKRIEALGGHVFFGRVFGALAVARAFGDSKYKQPKTSKNFVSVEPYLKTVKLTPSHKFIILACDGLWDVCSQEEAATFVYNKIKEGKTSQEIARALVNHALDLRTDDNVTVIIVNINWDKNGTPETQEGDGVPAQETHTDGTQVESGSAQ